MTDIIEEKTIAAISTPPGEGGIGVIRISGRDAIAVADSVFRSVSGKKLAEIKGYTALYGKVFDKDRAIDEAVALLFRAPHSYTGENVVELSLHGGAYVLREALRTVYKAGAVPSQAGEFTKRAYLNGKINLLEAEAVMGIISASGEATRRAALEVREGTVSKKVAEIKDNLLTAAAGLTVYCDYPDDELPEFSPETLEKSLRDAENGLRGILKNYDVGKVLREGVDTVLCGRPNVGKSTLMNLLVGSRRSIVTATAGTTRDAVEETVALGDLMLRLTDTAGLRETDDEIELIGVGISREKIEKATLIIAVFDASEEANSEDLELLKICRDRPSIAVVNKSDLDVKFNLELTKGIETVVLSAEKTVDALDIIRKSVEKVTGTALKGDESFLCTERQRNATYNALKSVTEAKELLHSGMTLDAVGVIIDEAIASLLLLTGEKVTEAVVSEVFSKFCVGK